MSDTDFVLEIGGLVEAAAFGRSGEAHAILTERLGLSDVRDEILNAAAGGRPARLAGATDLATLEEFVGDLETLPDVMSWRLSFDGDDERPGIVACGGMAGDADPRGRTALMRNGVPTPSDDDLLEIELLDGSEDAVQRWSEGFMTPLPALVVVRRRPGSAVFTADVARMAATTRDDARRKTLWQALAMAITASEGRWNRDAALGMSEVLATSDIDSMSTLTRSLGLDGFMLAIEPVTRRMRRPGREGEDARREEPPPAAEEPTTGDDAPADEAPGASVGTGAPIAQLAREQEPDNATPGDGATDGSVVAGEATQTYAGAGSVDPGEEPFHDSRGVGEDEGHADEVTSPPTEDGLDEAGSVDARAAVLDALGGDDGFWDDPITPSIDDQPPEAEGEDEATTVADEPETEAPVPETPIQSIGEASSEEPSVTPTTDADEGEQEDEAWIWPDESWRERRDTLIAVTTDELLPPGTAGRYREAASNAARALLHVLAEAAPGGTDGFVRLDGTALRTRLAHVVEQVVQRDSVACTKLAAVLGKVADATNDQGLAARTLESMALMDKERRNALLGIVRDAALGRDVRVPQEEAEASFAHALKGMRHVE